MTTKTTTFDCGELISTRQTREMRIEARAVDEDARTVDLAISSEMPVERWWGREVLDHGAGSVRMARFLDGAPLLLGHDGGAQIGVIESARLDSDRVLRAVARFSRGSLGSEIYQDVRDGIRSKVSVGYLVHAMQLEDTKDGEDTYRVTDWEPLEASIVSIPADSSVGVGRAIQQTTETATMPENMANKQPVDERDESTVTETTTKKPDAERDPAPVRAMPVNPEADQIRAVGKHFRMADEAEDHIMLGGTLAEFRERIKGTRADPVAKVPKIESRIPMAHGRLKSFRAETFGSASAANEAAYRAGMWARAMIAGDPEAARWCRDYGVQLSTRVMTGQSGGQSALVPDELLTPIIDLREQYGLARRICDVTPMMSDTATVPRRTSGVTAYFVGRSDATTASDAGFDNIGLVAREVSALTRLSNAYLADSVINLADHLAREMAYAFAVKEDDCLINGDGTATYGGIVGLRTHLSAAGGLAGAVDAPSGLDTFAEITDAALNSVIGKLPYYPGMNPVWVVSKAGAYNMMGRLMAAAGGNTKRNLAEAMPQQYSGYDIEICQAMPSVLTDLSDVVMALFGDFRMGVVFGDRMGVEVQVLTERYAEYRQTGIIATERFDINCHGVGDATNPGPIVALVGE